MPPTTSSVTWDPVDRSCAHTPMTPGAAKPMSSPSPTSSTQRRHSAAGATTAPAGASEVRARSSTRTVSAAMTRPVRAQGCVRAGLWSPGPACPVACAGVVPLPHGRFGTFGSQVGPRGHTAVSGAAVRCGRHQGGVMSQLTGKPGSPSTPNPPPSSGSSFGLPQSTALVMGSIIGVGIFSLPYAIAPYGPISLVAMALATVGAVALAFMFAVLSRRIPADGGPYAYARAAFGNGFGFSQAWLYWITAWAGNAAIVVGWVFYVEKFVNKGGSTAGSIVIALVGLWIPAAVNLTGVRNMGVFQVWSTVLKFIPLALMATVGLFFIEAGNYTPWNTSGDTNVSAIGGAMAICLFSYLGVETAAVAAGKVRNPSATCPGRRSSAPWPARWSTCSRSSPSSGSSPH